MFGPERSLEPGGEARGLGPGSSDTAQPTFPGRGQAQPTGAFLEKELSLLHAKTVDFLEDKKLPFCRKQL